MFTMVDINSKFLYQMLYIKLRNTLEDNSSKMFHTYSYMQQISLKYNNLLYANYKVPIYIKFRFDIVYITKILSLYGRSREYT
jgi:hypothetical protein